MEEILTSLLRDWDSWSTEADKANDGWQSDYPRWTDLMNAAIEAMERNNENISAIEKCWLLSEEDEWFVEHVKNNPTRYMALLTKLAKSIYSSVRWQVYASLEE